MCPRRQHDPPARRAQPEGRCSYRQRAALSALLLIQSLLLTSCDFGSSLRDIPWWGWVLVALGLIIVVIVVILLLPEELIVGLIAAIGEVFIALIEIAIEILTGFFQWLLGLIVGFFEWLLGLIESISGWLSRLWPTLAEKIPALLRAIGEWLGNRFPWLQGLINYLSEKLFNPVLTWIKQNTWKTIIGVFVTAWGLIQKGVLTYIKDWFLNLFSGMSPYLPCGGTTTLGPYQLTRTGHERFWHVPWGKTAAQTQAALQARTVAAAKAALEKDLNDLAKQVQCGAGCTAYPSPPQVTVTPSPIVVTPGRLYDTYDITVTAIGTISVTCR